MIPDEAIKRKVLECKFINKDVIDLAIEFYSDVPMPIPSHVRIFNLDLSVTRPYTPIKYQDNQLFFKIKIYPNGNFGNYFKTLNPNDYIYTTDFMAVKNFDLSDKNILMIAGGTGITPIYQIMNKHIKSKNVNFLLLNLNKRKEDIFMIEDLKKFEEYQNFEIHNILSREKIANLDHNTKLDKDRLNEIIKDKNINFVFICGPRSLMQEFSGIKISRFDQGKLTGILKELGFSENKVFKF